MHAYLSSGFCACVCTVEHTVPFATLVNENKAQQKAQCEKHRGNDVNHREIRCRDKQCVV